MAARVCGKVPVGYRLGLGFGVSAAFGAAAINIETRIATQRTRSLKGAPWVVLASKDRCKKLRPNADLNADCTL